MFEVTYGTNLHEYTTRKEAIDAAKEISGEYRGMVNIADGDGRERMVYQPASWSATTTRPAFVAARPRTTSTSSCATGA